MTCSSENIQRFCPLRDFSLDLFRPILPSHHGILKFGPNNEIFWAEPRMVFWIWSGILGAPFDDAWCILLHGPKAESGPPEFPMKYPVLRMANPHLILPH